jgi:hypothetical protein
MGGKVSLLSSIAYYMIAGILLGSILFLKLSSLIEILFNRDYDHMFEVAAGKSMLVIWLEVQAQTIILMVPYYILVMYFLQRNINDMHKQLSDQKL